MNIHATRATTSAENSQPRFLMCPPRHFAVTYKINPWMDPQAWAGGGSALHEAALSQWAGLCRALADAGAMVETIEPEPGLPDLVFTANAGVVLDGKLVPARFRHGERQAEEPAFAASFAALEAKGLIGEIVPLPPGITLEGAGDCLFDRWRGLFWLGCGFRSDAAAGAALERTFGLRAIALPLADPRFYHLDTALCTLPSGAVIYYPGAFTPQALAAIHAEVAPAERIALDETDASAFAANAVCAGQTIVLSSCSAALRQDLERRGYAVIETPLEAFQRSGGSACCLTLRLDHRSDPARPLRQAIASPLAARNTRAASSSRRSA